MEYVEVQGARIPALGFGTFQLDEATAQRMVQHAVATGYRHIDTAQMYDNERAVGTAITASAVPRDEIWLTTKVWTDNFRAGDLQDSAKQSLEKLGTDYVDLLLLHWPNPDVPLEETISALNDARDQGLARHIGISNFPTPLIREAVKRSAGPLITDQVEYHPFLNQSPVLEELRQHEMALTAYSPLAQGEVFQDETLNAIGKAYGKTGGQVALRWLLQQHKVIAIPRSSKPEHVESNFNVFDFALSEQDMQTIAELARPDGRIINPSFAPDWDNAA